jgi:glycosyltransferase involved in cell wall biosynthesis
MRVLHINHEKTWRGGERQTVFAVQEQRCLNVDSWLACRTGAPLEKMANERGLPVISLPGGPFSTLFTLCRQLSKFDLVHCHSARAHSLVALACARRRKQVVVSRRVDFLPRRSWFNRFKYNRAAKVVCVSRYIADQMRNWGLRDEQLEVIYDAAGASESLCSKQQCRDQLSAKVRINPEHLLVGNIAAMVGHKDQATLLRAARVLVNERPDVAFVIIGAGELSDELVRLRGDLNLAGSVHFTGFIPEAEKLLPAFDVFAMSSCMEGLGSIVLDANLAGVPVAATAGGGLPEIVNDHETGLLVPVKDARALAGAILTLLSDFSLANRLARAAQTRTRNEFSPGQMAKQYLRLYEKLLTRASNHGAGESGESRPQPPG